MGREMNRHRARYKDFKDRIFNFQHSDQVVEPKITNSRMSHGKSEKEELCSKYLKRERLGSPARVEFYGRRVAENRRECAVRVVVDSYLVLSKCNLSFINQYVLSLALRTNVWRSVRRLLSGYNASHVFISTYLREFI